MAAAGGQGNAAPVVTQHAIQNALTVGAATGGTGFIVGATAGLLRNTSPLLFGLGSGLQCFGLGTFYWGGRSAVLSAWYTDRALATPRDRIYASALGGGFSGVAMALLTRGRSNVIPGGIMFSLFGGLGQSVYNLMDSRNAAKMEAGGDKETLTEWVAKQKWSPFSILTDAQYESILREKILKVDVEIALIDDRIREMQAKGSAMISIDNELPK
ncbi:hypothetical protein K461DRAFT_289540 [Myriangium duriaei CBS 260.36]|uniref:Uncharacterized protein n=1 Tax=Myriangium duriaei CBS 260.36 TaxID=1168546 RepID=A0A9P4MPF8_9PEZI|nr:hypothetical protein K461DRAFT_289540 [Myriangium duriaei CBS 260.36]